MDKVQEMSELETERKQRLSELSDLPDPENWHMLGRAGLGMIVHVCELSDAAGQLITPDTQSALERIKELLDDNLDPAQDLNWIDNLYEDIKRG